MGVKCTVSPNQFYIVSKVIEPPLMPGYHGAISTTNFQAQMLFSGPVPGGGLLFRGL